MYVMYCVVLRGKKRQEEGKAPQKRWVDAPQPQVGPHNSQEMVHGKRGRGNVLVDE